MWRLRLQSSIKVIEEELEDCELYYQIASMINSEVGALLSVIRRNMQWVAQHTMHQLVRCIFSHLPDVDQADRALVKGSNSSKPEADGVDADYSFIGKENGNEYESQLSSGAFTSAASAALSGVAGDNFAKADNGKDAVPYEHPDGVPCMVETFHNLCEFLLKHEEMGARANSINVFEEIANLLSKSAFPVNSPLSSMHILALGGLIAKRKYIKRLLIGAVHFNRDLKKGYTACLDKNLVGDFLGNHDEFCVQVLNEFARTFDFQDTKLDTALRLFLESFQLPGESQKIQRHVIILDVLDDLIASLCKFKTLLNTSSVEELVLAFGDDIKARMATVKLVMQLMTQIYLPNLGQGKPLTNSVSSVQKQAIGTPRRSLGVNGAIQSAAIIGYREPQAAGRPQKGNSSPEDEDTAVFCLELLNAITLNRVRIGLLWKVVYEHIASIVQSTVMPYVYLEASEPGFDALLFIMSDGAHLSPANYVLCIDPAREFAESLVGQVERSVCAVDLMAGLVTCLARWDEDAQGSAMEVTQEIGEMWLRLTQALRKVCLDQRAEFRNHALLSLQMCLTGEVEGVGIPHNLWLQCFDMCFDMVILTMLDDLIEIAQGHSQNDYRNMEGTLVLALKLLSKVFLQLLVELSQLTTFCKLWLGVLSRMGKYMMAKVSGKKNERSCRN
ncbi:OLC1v1016384C1 [Oldenlandia corymbosa var. corymbosa]|uniref:OLC1v1016384C1 n=1 Tax=Oldenlandia corymbosa var. corymbosa TaxID=529605 RepID=A0AAV1E5L9_OLDCO|nr:OLC1v1016384C1 [Oldenlandia corymbosa var. corymbosa]